MSKVRRICFFGGPGSGKSTTSAHLFAELKKRNHDVEHIPEYIKTWAHEGRKPVSYDQFYCFAKQLRSEDVILRNVQVAIVDCPLMLVAAWCHWRGMPCNNSVVELAQQFDRDFPSLNLFIDRTVNYVSEGRYESKDQAFAFDNFLLEFLNKNLQSSLTRVGVNDFDHILTLTESHI